MKKIFRKLLLIIILLIIVVCSILFIIGFSTYSKALKEYARNKNKDILKLVKYAKKLDIEDEVVELMEVLL